MNKLVLVTGSAKGIGAKVVQKFCDNGYDVIINYKTSEKEAYKLKNSLKYNNIYVEKFDITNEEEVNNIFNKYNIDILINNASISIDDDIFLKTKEDFMKVLEVNLYGTFLMCRTFLKNNKSGVIINVSSTDAIDTYNLLSIDYCISKAGIINMTKNLALNFKSNKICAICPNWVNTESVREMDLEYLNSELKRIGQKKLIESEVISSKIYYMVTSDSVKSGDIVRVDYNE